MASPELLVELDELLALVLLLDAELLAALEALLELVVAPGDEL